MRKARLLYVCIFVLAVYTLNKAYAQKDTILLGYVKHTDPVYTDIWTYNEDYQPEKVTTIRADSMILMSYVFMRDANGRLVRSETRDTNQLPLVVFDYKYNDEGQVERIDKMVDADFNGVADNVEHIFYFTYDTAGRVETLRIIKGTRVERHYIYTWTNNNITGISNADGDLFYSMNLGYDQQENILRKIAWEYMITNGSLDFYALMFSNNNLVSAEFIPVGSEKLPMPIAPRYYPDGTYRTNSFEKLEYGYFNPVK